MSLAKSALTVGVFTMISRLLGFLRDMFIASRLGAGTLSDIFFVAFKLPNFFRHLFAEGAFNSAFVPLFSGVLAEKGELSAKEFAEKIAAVLFLALLIIMVVMQIAMPWVMYGLAPGFQSDPYKYDLAVYLTRITFPYLVFMSLVSLIGGVLNSVGRFAAAAFSPTLLNLCMIWSVVYLARYTETPAHALSIGVALSGFLQLVWVYGACVRAGIVLRPRMPRINEDVRLLLRRMIPGIVGAGVMQLNLWIDTVIATVIPNAVSYLYYADRVSQFPLAVIGTAMGTALLPVLSRQIREGKKEESIHTQNRGLELALLFTLPATVGLFVMAVPIVSVLFERGAFTPENTMATSHVLMALSCGLPAFIMAKVFTPGFFAVGDTRTPVRIAVICMITNTVMSLILIHPFSYVGLSISTAFSSWLNVFLLCTKLHKRNLFYFDAQVKKNVPLLFLASIVMGAGLWWATPYFPSHEQAHTLWRITLLSGLIIGGGAVFFFIAHITGGCDLRKLPLRRSKRQS